MYHELPDPTGRFGYLLWQAAHLVGRVMVEALQPVELTVAQLGVLSYTAQEPGISSAELARRLFITPQSVHTAVKPLVERALLERRPHPVNRKVIGVFLTPDGIDVADQATELLDIANKQLLADFTPDAAADLRQALRRVMVTANPTALDRSSVRSVPAAPIER
ncbi:MarR family winged helix-turn-helix transcriptional regulator [Curtobacterium sp. VKM Ac-1395]|uniref:MarR family winged helix-turn-helix transcriptional regulator n=1 Tax=Curtobacterium sp. VKM Ac-1395 TaxID=2783815 RepID=UPI00188B0B67|nr:MarR family transcriptional regulator [Curtobacterium sp. VKM Ac-1395]MBF4588913.1 MarR family transcriptional regulator [Curtobacterium sp. VKM Ac-1395]